MLTSRLDAGRLFEDIEESSRTIDSVALRIANPFYDTRPFESFDGAQGGGKRDRQFLRHSFCGDERICPQDIKEHPDFKEVGERMLQEWVKGRQLCFKEVSGSHFRVGPCGRFLQAFLGTRQKNRSAYEPSHPHCATDRAESADADIEMTRCKAFPAILRLRDRSYRKPIE